MAVPLGPLYDYEYEYDYCITGSFWHLSIGLSLGALSRHWVCAAIF